jgi:hypothetical protein
VDSTNIFRLIDEILGQRIPPLNPQTGHHFPTRSGKKKSRSSLSGPLTNAPGKRLNVKRRSWGLSHGLITCTNLLLRPWPVTLKAPVVGLDGRLECAEFVYGSDGVPRRMREIKSD